MPLRAGILRCPYIQLLGYGFLTCIGEKFHRPCSLMLAGILLREAELKRRSHELVQNHLLTLDL
jgi:hypothetical protein